MSIGDACSLLQIVIPERGRMSAKRAERPLDNPEKGRVTRIISWLRAWLSRRGDRAACGGLPSFYRKLGHFLLACPRPTGMSVASESNQKRKAPRMTRPRSEASRVCGRAMGFVFSTSCAENKLAGHPVASSFARSSRHRGFRGSKSESAGTRAQAPKSEGPERETSEKSENPRTEG